MTSSPRPFDALRLPGFRVFLLTFIAHDDGRQRRARHDVLGRLQKFHSAALGGFRSRLPLAALSRIFRPRRRAQRSLRLTAADPDRCRAVHGVSFGWGYFFVTNTLQVWHAMLLLVMHGCAGVFWMTSSQVLLYDVVGQSGIASAVRLNATRVTSACWRAQAWVA